MARTPHPLLLAIAVSVLVLTACGGDGGSSPTAPGPDRTLALTEASLTVNGQPVQSGETFPHQHEAGGGTTRFEATLMDRNGPALGHRVEVRFQRPDGMMHGSGVFRLYDDGTHGDHVPGDGVYCFEDTQGAYGFCHGDARHGRYHYDFCGLYPDGAETNHREIEIDVRD